MTTVKKQTNSQKKASQKKVTKSYTTTSGVKVTKYSDGTEKRTGGSSSSSSGSSSSPKSSPVIQAVGGTREQQLANANAQMANIQKMMSDPSTKLTSAQSSSIASQLGTASAELAKIPKATAPTTPTAINPQVGETKIPETQMQTGDTVDSAGYLASNTAITDAIEQQRKDALARQEENNKQQESFMDKMLGSFNDTKRIITDSIEKQDEAWNNYLAQAEGARAEIKTYNDKYAEVEAAMNEQIAKTNDAMGSMNFINNQVQQIQKNAAPQLALLAAKSANASADLALLQGDYQMADKHLQNAVDNMTALSKFEYETAKDFYTINQDLFNQTESIYASSYKDMLQALKDKHDEEVADANLKKQAILEYADAGIKLTDSLETMAQKIANSPTAQLNRRKAEADIANALSSGSGSGNSNQMTDNERALSGQFRSEQIVKDYNTILSKKLSVDAIIDAGVGGPGDLALVYEFMKGLDPTSVVRETEYATAAKSGNIFLGSLARFNGYFKEEGGFMPDNVKESFRSIVDSKLAVQTRLYDNLANEYTNMAVRQGLNPENVVLGYSNAAPVVGRQSSYTQEELKAETEGVTFAEPKSTILTKFVNWADSLF